MSYEEHLHQKWKEDNKKCSICLERVDEKQLIELECCGLALHHECFKDLIKSKAIKPGNKISLQSLSCINCRNRMKHKASNDLLSPVNALHDKLSDIAVKQLSYNNRVNDKELIEEKGEFYGNPEGYSMKLYSFHICYKCKQPYCSGDKSCIEEMKETDVNTEHYVCVSCQPAMTAEENLWKAIFKSMIGNGVYLCPNDHIYFIANCTYPHHRLVYQCHVCGASIGGSNREIHNYAYDVWSAAPGNRRVGYINASGELVKDNMLGDVPCEWADVYFYTDETSGSLRITSEMKK